MASNKFLVDIDVTGKIDATGTVLGSNLSGTNTGDQNLSGYLLNTTDTFTGDLTMNGDIILNGDSEHKLYFNSTSLITAATVDTTILTGRQVDIYAYDDVVIRSGSTDAIKLMSGGSLALTLDSSQNATFAGTVGASNLSGTNTGDQDLSGYLLNTTDTLTGNLTVTATTTSNAVNVGTATGGIAGSQFTTSSDSTSTGTTVNTWMDVNRVHTAISTGDTYGSVSRVVSNSSFLDAGIIGSNSIGRQSGSGGAGYIYGTILTAEQTGGGDVDFIIAASIRSKSLNNSTGTVDYNRGISVAATHDSTSGTVNNLQSAHLTTDLVSGTAGTVQVLLLDFDRTTGTITNDFAYLQIQADTGNHTVGGTARSIHSLNTLPSEFAGSIESTSFIKTGGTSSQFLKADGSIDSTVYTGDQDLSGYLLNTSDTLTGNLTITGTVSGSNLSGTNTGDNAVNSLYSGLVSNVTTNLTTTHNATTVVVNSSDGTNATVNGATASLAGVVTNTTQTFAGDKTFDDLILVNTATDSGYLMTVGTKDSTGNLYSIYAQGRIFTTGDVGCVTVTGSGAITGGSFIKSGGTSSQFLMADGSTSAGVGDFDAQISTLTNADTAFHKAGTYRYSTTTSNTPNDYGTILTTVDSGGDYNGSNNWLTQMAHGTNNVSYLRYKVNAGAFTSWRQLAFTDSHAGTSASGTVSTGTQSFAGNKTFSGSITASSFIKSGGTNQQFLKANGSIDSNTYNQDHTVDHTEQIALSDETTALTTGTSIVTFRTPGAIIASGFRLSCATAPTGNKITVDINDGGVSILTTKLTIDAGEKTSLTAAIAMAFTATGDEMINDAEITVDIDGVGSTIAGAGLKLIMYYNYEVVLP